MTAQYTASSPPSPAARPAFIRLCNRIAGRQRPLRFEWNGQPAIFSFRALNQAPRGTWSLGIQLGGHDMRVELSRLPDLTWVSPTLAGIDLQSLPPELGCGIVATCLGDIFAALAKGGIDVRITKVEPKGLDFAITESVEWNIDRGAETGWMRGRIAGEDAGLEHLAQLMQRAPVALADDKALPMPVSLVAAAMKLTLAELKALELHDVLLADLAAHASLRTCQLWCSGRALGAGTLKDHTFTLQQLNPAEATIMGDPALTAAISDLEVQLTFVAGQTTLTVGELRSLAPGFVFELPVPAGDGLIICANGRPVGKGELIDVGDRTGVRITQLSAP